MTGAAPDPEPAGPERRRFLFALVVVAAALRFTAIGHESYWYDESVSVFNASVPLAGIPQAVAERDVSPPLYFLVLGLWMKVFGAGEAAVRSLSALGSLIALVFFHRAATFLAGARAADLAATLFAFSPFSIRFAQEARMYGLLLPLAWAAFALVARELARPPPRRWIGFAALSLTLLYTHAFGAFVPLLALLAVAARAGASEARRLAAFLVPVGLAFLPWLSVMVSQAKARIGGFWIGKPVLSSIHYLAYILAGGSPTAATSPVLAGAGWLAVRLAYVMIAVALVAAWRSRQTRSADDVQDAPDAPAAAGRHARAVRACVVALSLPIGLVFVVSHLVTPLFVDRYFLFLAPFFWLLLALCSERLPGRARWAAVAVLVVLWMPILADHLARPHKEQWREAVAFMQGSGLAADTIVDTGGMMNLIVYLEGVPHAPQTSTLQGGFPPRHLTGGELSSRLTSARSLWVFYSAYAPDPGAYRRALKLEFDEVTHREFTGLSVGYYRRSRVLASP